MVITMAKEIVTTGKTIEEAVAKACSELGVPEEKCSVEVIEKPKRSLFGKIKVEAKVRVTVKEMLKVEVPAAPAAAAQPQTSEKAAETAPVEEPVSKTANSAQKLAAASTYLKDVLAHMGLDQVQIKEDANDDGAVLTLEGENLGILIGRHGETLDALQYLTSLVCNRVEGSYYRVTIDCGNYREKREVALKELAKKIAGKVKRTGRSQMLEPMNPYERRIIHAVITEIDGVTSKSKGEEPNRRVVILSTNRRQGGYSNGQRKKPAYKKRQPERTMEQILKGEFTETEKNTKRYSKIEL